LPTSFSTTLQHRIPNSSVSSLFKKFCELFEKFQQLASDRVLTDAMITDLIYCCTNVIFDEQVGLLQLSALNLIRTVRVSPSSSPH
jgi:hypothetical protein